MSDSHSRRATDDGPPQAVREVKARSHTRALILNTARLLAGEILPTRSGVEALRYIAEAARELTGARFAAIGVAKRDVKSEGRGFSDLVTAGFSSEEPAGFAASLCGPCSEISPEFAFEVPSDRAAPSDGVLQLLLERDEPLRLQSSPDAGGATFLGVPLRRGATALGALYVAGKGGPQPFTNADEADLLALGVHATAAIHNLHALQREQALIAGLLTAHERERRVIAYDLHDGLTQSVMAAHIHLEAFEYARQRGKEDKAALELAETSKYLQKAVVESRRMIRGLRTLTLDDLGLGAALEQLLKDEREHANWSSTELRCNLDGARFDSMLETAIYRVAQEALANARRHAQASSVKVSCERRFDEATGAAHLQLQVSDSGRGFDVQARAFSLTSREGVGLFSMRERTRVLGGEFEFHSTPGAGTSLSASFPLPPEESKLDET